VWIGNAGAGEEIMPFKSDTPSEAFSMFVDNVLSYLSASSSMSIEFLKNKFGQNYSASRATLVIMWRVINMWRQEMIADYLNVIAQAWMAEEIAAGRIQAPGFSDPILRAAWMNIRWVGSSMPNIDPKKEAEARKINVMMGTTTLDDCALEHNGSDGQRNRAQLKREYGELTLPPWESQGGSGDGIVDDGRDTSSDVSDSEDEG
jgi:capsid protein